MAKKSLLKRCWHRVAVFLPLGVVAFVRAVARAFREIKMVDVLPEPTPPPPLRPTIREPLAPDDHRLLLDSILRELRRLHVRLEEADEMRAGMPTEQWSRRSDAA